MITIIVSRYNEDISWLYTITYNKLIEKILIFNKGNDDIKSHATPDINDSNNFQNTYLQKLEILQND